MAKTKRLFIKCLTFIILLMTPSGAIADVGYEIEIIGEPEIVFNYSKDACDANDIPDVHARIFKDANNKIQLIASHHINRRMIGPDLDHLKRDCHVIYQSVKDPNPGHFQDYEWLVSTYRNDDNTIYALIHNEFHAGEHGLCDSKNGLDCWYNAITSAVSTDSGKSYHHLKKAPNHFVATIPYKYERNGGPVGIFGGTNIINGPDGYYYFLAKIRLDHNRKSGICVFRTTDLSKPHSWRAWDGQDFNIKSINPYINKNNPANHIPTIVSAKELADMDPGNVTFNTFIQQYVMVGTVHAINPKTGQMTYSVAFSVSKDLIHWSNRMYIIDAPQGGSYKLGDAVPIGYPSFIDPESASLNYETTGQEFDMYYTRFNYDRRPFNSLDRDLLRVKLKLQTGGAS